MDESSGLYSGTVLALLEDSTGALWAGTWRSGLIRYKDGVFSSINTEQGLGNNTINALLEDSEGRLWIGTRGGGISRLSNGKLETFTTADGLSDNLVFAFYEDDAGSIWIGTYGGGLNRYKNGEFSAVTEDQGLFDDVIHRIIDDGRGRLWMSSNRGIFSVAKNELDMAADGELAAVNSVVFGVNDGMKNVECNGGGNAGILGSDGALWFPSVAGLLRVAPDAVEASDSLASLLIEEVVIGGSPLPDAKKLNLPAGANNLEIHYTAVDLHSPEKLTFRYRMQDYDKDWINAGSRRTAYYSQLPAGRYQFQVQARYGPNLSDMQEISAELSVAPRWYETGWFRGMFLLALLFLAYALYRLRTSQVTRRTLQLEREVSERTAALEEANRQLKQLSIEDGLTGLLNRRAFDAILQDECRRGERAQVPLALMMLDIDYFKQFNDIYGHQAGDTCLILVADTLKKACGRAGEFVARYGGEEIAIILPATSPDYARQQAENLRCRLADLAIPHSGSVAADMVTVSIGVTSLIPRTEMSPSALLAAADKALYKAKEAGRNKVEFADVEFD
jgi:diguanylate cyclase (GGDEF)-like protein